MAVSFGAYAADIFRMARRVAVGADGVRVIPYLGRDRFIPFSTIASVSIDGPNVELRLRDDEDLRLSLLTRAPEPLAEVRSMVERIREGIHRDARSSVALPQLVRGERSTEEWLRELAIARDDRASFRSPAIPADELWRLVEDPSAAPTARLGAAVALRSDIDEPGRERLRVIADACAASHLRVALETIAEDDELREDALEMVRDDTLRA